MVDLLTSGRSAPACFCAGPAKLNNIYRKIAAFALYFLKLEKSLGCGGFEANRVETGTFIQFSVC